jgi:hypothetical protein
MDVGNVNQFPHWYRIMSRIILTFYYLCVHDQIMTNTNIIIETTT